MPHGLIRCRPGPLLALFMALALGCDGEPPRGPKRSEAVPVTVTAVERRTLKATESAIGSLRAKAEVELRPEVAGRVDELAFREGEAVEKGQLLVALDDRRLRQRAQAQAAALAAARARLEQARTRFQRNASLLENDAIAEDSFDTAQTELEAAQAEVGQLRAQLAEARTELRDTRIEAPFTGVTSEHEVDVGDYAAVGDPLTTLYRTEALETAFTLPERSMGRVERGQPVVVRVAAFPQQRFQGRVTYVSPSVDEQTRDLRIKATIHNRQGRLKPGAFARVEVTLERRPGLSVIPEEALVSARGGYRVFVVDQRNRAQRRSVRIGLRRPGLVVVREGLRPGERVVRTGHLRLTDGARVRVTDSEVAADDAPGGARPPPAGEAGERP